MAIVGTAYIKIKAITADFQKEADAAYEKFYRMVTTGYAIGPALATAVGGISSMVSGLVALTSQIAAALPALIVLPSMFSAIGQAAMTAKMAFSGIGAAMKALTKKSGGGGGNSKQVEQAEKRLTQVLESNREALVRANDRLTEAEERLTKARIDASESLQQLNFDAEDAAISEKKAAIELEKARETLARVQDLPPNSRARREAELAYQEADLNMRRAKDTNADLTVETEKRNRLGVEGSEEVVDATKAVQEAVDARAKAELEALRALIDAQEALNDAKKGSGGGGADDEALSKLSAEARAFAEYLIKIKPELVTLRHAAGRKLFGPLEDALDNIVKKLFPALIPILEQTGEALGKSALDFSNIVTAEDNLKNLNEVASTNTDTIGKLGTIFGNLYDVFLTVLSAADPLIRRFTDWLVVLTTGWKETNEVNKKSKSLADTFKLAGDIAAQLGRALGKNGLFGAIMNIGRAAAGPGSGGEMLLDTFEKSMKKFDEFTAKMLADGSLEKFFLDASANFAKISSLAVDLVKEFLKLGDDAAIGQSADILRNFVPVIGEIFAILQSAGPYLADFVTKLGEFLALFVESKSIEIFFGTLELALDVLIAIFSNPIIQKVALFTAAIMGAVKALSLMGRVGRFAMLVVSKYMRMATAAAVFAKKAFLALKFEMFRVHYYFVTLSTPVLLAVAAIVALVAIFYLAYKNSEKLRNALKELYEKVLAKIIEVFNEVKGALEEVMASMGGTEGFAVSFKNVFKSIGDFLAKHFVPILEKILMPLIEGIGHAFKGIIYVIGAVIKVFQSVYEFIRGVFSLLTGDVDGAKEHFGKSFSAIAKAFEFAFKAIKEIFLTVFDAIKVYFAPFIGVFTFTFALIVAVVRVAFNIIKPIAVTAFKVIGATLKFVWNNVIKPIIAALKFGFEVAFAAIKIALNVLKEVFKKVWTVIKVAFKVAMIAIAIALVPLILAAGAIYFAFKYTFIAIMAVFNTVWPVITAAVGFLWSKVFKPVLGFILAYYKFVFNTFVTIVKFVFGIIASAISFYWNNVIKPIFNLMKTIFEVVWNGIAAAIGFVWNTLILPVFNAMKAVFEIVWAGIKLYFETVWSLIQIAIGVGVTVITAAFNVISTVFGVVWSGIKAAFDFVWGLILGAVNLGVGIMSGLFNGIKDAFSAVFGTLAGIATSAFGVVTGVIASVINGIITALEWGVNLAIKAINILISAYNAVPLVSNVDPLDPVSFGRVDLKRQASIDATTNAYRDAAKYLAGGGVVSPRTGGTLAVIGEAGRPERVEPLDPDGLSKRDKAMITLLTGGKGGGITMNVYPSPGMNETELASKISRELAFQLRRGAA